MSADVIKMNGAGFRTSFVLSLSLQEFVDWGVTHDIYYQSGAKQREMLVTVWNIVHKKTSTYVVNDPKPERKAMMPKAVSVKKK